MGIKISYGITVFNELKEIQYLLPFLFKFKRNEDEIVVLFDDKGPNEVWKYLESLGDKIKLHPANFNNDFAEWKNKLNKLCSGDWIIQLDSDELPNINLIQNIPFILENNPDSDIFLVPRVNIVKGIGLSHIQKWGWKVSKLESMKEEKIFDLSNPKDLDEYNLLKQNNLIIEENIIKM